MRELTKNELLKVVKLHQKWLNNEKGGKVADLRDADLRGTNLRGSILGVAILSGANLMGVNLQNANLKYANLRGANMRGANLCGADLKCADLCDADLRESDMTNANLTGADLRNADLLNSDMTNANLTGANFDKKEECRKGLILHKSIKGYKITMERNIIELEIPVDAIVFSINKSKCRTNKAIVTRCDGIQHSLNDGSFEYYEGKVIKIDDFDLQYNVECSTGVHFFKTKKEAKEYQNKI